MIRIAGSLLTASIFLLITGCTTVNSKVGSYFNMDTDLEMNFKVDADSNPDEGGKPSPLFVRMYELKAPKMFNKADFIDLYERDEEVLGADLVKRHELKRFTPGDERQDHFVLDKNTQYVALYAEFLDYKDSPYRVVFPVVANNVWRSKANIHITGNAIILIP